MQGTSSEITRKIAVTSGVVLGLYLIAALLMYIVESDADGAMITTYPDALWYALVTVSTVGYGDMYPITFGGKILGGVLILASVGFIGYVVGKFGEYAVENSRRKFLGMNGTKFNNHYIVIGWSELARIVISEMLAAGFQVAVLTNRENDIAEMRSIFTDSSGFFAAFGVYEGDEAYRRVNIRAATGAIILTGDDTATLVTVLHLRQLNPNLKITAYIKNSQLKKTVENAGVSYVVSPNEVVGRMIASAAFEPDVSTFLEDILSTTTADDDLDIQEYRLKPDHELINKTIHQAGDAILSRTGARFLAYSRKNGNGWKVSASIEGSETLQAEDHLIVMANHSSGRKLKEYLGVSQGRAD